MTCLNADPSPLRADVLLLFGEVTELEPSLLVSSRSMGDRGRSRLLAGLLSLSLLSSRDLEAATIEDGGEAAVGGEWPLELAAEAAAAESKCCRRPGLRPKSSKCGFGGLMRPLIGNLKS